MVPWPLTVGTPGGKRSEGSHLPVLPHGSEGQSSSGHDHFSSEHSGIGDVSLDHVV